MIGLLRELFTLQKSTETQDDSGGTVRVWSDVREIRVEERSVPFNVALSNAQLWGSQTSVLRTWYLEDLSGVTEEISQFYRLKKERKGVDYFYTIVSTRPVIGEGITRMFTELVIQLIHN